MDSDEDAAVVENGTPTAAEITRGTARLLRDHEVTPVLELSLVNGRRVDIMGLGRDGRIWVVEIKSSRQDFMSDHKWQDYLEYCDRFYFAVAIGFPHHLLPAEEGLILADRYHGELVRPAIERPLAGARRKALTLRFARTAATRLQTLIDPESEGGR